MEAGGDARGHQNRIESRRTHFPSASRKNRRIIVFTEPDGVERRGVPISHPDMEHALDSTRGAPSRRRRAPPHPHPTPHDALGEARFRLSHARRGARRPYAGARDRCRLADGRLDAVALSRKQNYDPSIPEPARRRSVGVERWRIQPRGKNVRSASHRGAAGIPRYRARLRRARGQAGRLASRLAWSRSRSLCSPRCSIRHRASGCARSRFPKARAARARMT